MDYRCFLKDHTERREDSALRCQDCYDRITIDDKSNSEWLVGKQLCQGCLNEEIVSQEQKWEER